MSPPRRSKHLCNGSRHSFPRFSPLVSLDLLVHFNGKILHPSLLLQSHGASRDMLEATAFHYPVDDV